MINELIKSLEYTTKAMTGNCTERIGGHGDVCSGCKSVALKNYTLIERAKKSTECTGECEPCGACERAVSNTPAPQPVHMADPFELREVLKERIVGRILAILDDDGLKDRIANEQGGGNTEAATYFYEAINAFCAAVRERINN